MSQGHLPSTERTILGHPTGLFVLFFTEMWERFSFYGMKALLIFYLVKYHLFSNDEGYLILGSYAALVYAIPVLGGYLADKFLGFRKAITFGAVLLVLGHAGMAYEGNAATEMASGAIQRDNFALQVFYFSLALIILGVGFLKANISSIVGELYRKGDARRDSGFTIFYMGINLGSFFATLICAWLGEAYGWGYGFGAAGVGMVAGLITFIMGKKHLMGKGEPPHPEKLQRKVFAGLSQETIIYSISILSLLVIWQMVQRHSVVEVLLMVAGAISLAYISYQAFFKSTRVERDRLISLTILIIFSVVFWALFEQAYSSINLFTEQIVDRQLGTREIYPGQFLSLNALFIFLLAPVFAWIWISLTKRRMNPNAAVKFGLAILMVGFGFGILVLGDKMADGGKIGMIWLVLMYLLHTIGELFLSPVGLSYVTKLSPVRMIGFMMGVWFLATAGSEYIAVLLAKISSVPEVDGETASFLQKKEGFISLYESLFYLAMVIGAFLLLISPLLKRMMHGVDDETEESPAMAIETEDSDLLDN